jgi:glutathione peroxidase-family protein
MKFIIILIGLLVPPLSFEQSIYTIQLQVVGSNPISMSAFKEKKIIITAFSTSHPDGGYLKYLNYLQKNDNALKVIAVPALDFGGSISDEKLLKLKDSLGLSITITKPGYVQKVKGGNQHRLFKWLTKTEENSHFDRDVEQYDQLYLISRKGTLYAVFPKGIAETSLMKALNEGISE